MMYSGILIAFTELYFYYTISYDIRNYLPRLKNIDKLTYYWLTMTILTFIWESSFIFNYNKVCNMSTDLILKNQHVWTNTYSISSIMPNKLAIIFYAEYGAYADREYMLGSAHWSRVIEGSHAYLCGIFAILSLYCKHKKMNKEHLIMTSISMGTQLMNSILYMSNYFIQVYDKDNVNYSRPNFPAGLLLYKRPFMYVNIFWTLMPSYVLYRLIEDNQLRQKISFK